MNRRSFISALSVVAAFFGFKQADAAPLGRTGVKSVLVEKSIGKYGPYELFKYENISSLYFKNDKGEIIGSIVPIIKDYTKYNPGMMYAGFGYQVFGNLGSYGQEFEVVNGAFPAEIILKDSAQNIQKIRNEHLGHD